MQSRHASRFVVAIPVFNERDHLLDVVAEVQNYAENIVIIDDGSTDGTTELLRSIDGVARIFHPENRGYGQALISSFRHTIENGYDWLVTMDCDEQHEPAFIPRFVEAAFEDDSDIISGSRYLVTMDGNSTAPADRRRINHAITHVLNELLGFGLTDSFCGFKAYRATALNRLRIDIPGYAMPLQLWVQAAAMGMQVRELAVRLIYNDPTRHFGGLLDDPDSRLAHYLEVLSRELVATRLLEDEDDTRQHVESLLS